jgi:hypothetical protein
LKKGDDVHVRANTIWDYIRVYRSHYQQQQQQPQSSYSPARFFPFFSVLGCVVELLAVHVHVSLLIDIPSDRCLEITHQFRSPKAIFNVYIWGWAIDIVNVPNNNQMQQQLVRVDTTLFGVPSTTTKKQPKQQPKKYFFPSQKTCFLVGALEWNMDNIPSVRL